MEASKNRSNFVVKIKGQQSFMIKDALLNANAAGVVSLIDMGGACIAAIPTAELLFIVATQAFDGSKESVRKTLAELAEG